MHQHLDLYPREHGHFHVSCAILERPCKMEPAETQDGRALACAAARLRHYEEVVLAAVTRNDYREMGN